MVTIFRSAVAHPAPNCLELRVGGIGWQVKVHNVGLPSVNRRTALWLFVVYTQTGPGSCALSKPHWFGTVRAQTTKLVGLHRGLLPQLPRAALLGTAVFGMCPCLHSTATGICTRFFILWTFVFYFIFYKPETAATQTVQTWSVWFRKIAGVS